MNKNTNFNQSTIDTNLHNLFKSQQPERQFEEALAKKLLSHYQDLQLPRTEDQDARSQPRKLFWMKLSARPATLILSILIAMLALTGIVYAVGRLSGYIPGFGFANSSQSIYVLSERIQLEENGVLTQVEQAVSDENKFWVKLSAENLVEQPISLTAYLLLEDGTRVEYELGENRFADGLASFAFSFPALPPGTTTLTLTIEDLIEKSLHIPLVLRPIREGELLPVAEQGEYPLLSPLQQGLRLSLDYVAPASDRTVFQVSLQFDEPYTMIIGQWTVTLSDQEGRVYPLTEITPSNIDRGQSALFQTAPFRGNEDLILTLVNVPQLEKNINVMRDYSTNPGKFTFDPGENPQPGQVWDLDEQVQVGEFDLHLIKAELINAEEILFEFETHQNVTGVMLFGDSPDVTSGHGGDPMGDQNFNSVIGFHQLPVEPIEIQVIWVYFRIPGEWQLEWTPPAAPMESSAQVFPSATVPILPTPTATIPITDALYLEVKRLSDQFDAPYQQGPGWVHIVTEQHSKVVEGQLLPPPYYKSDEWYQIDTDGYVQRSLYTDYTDKDIILQQVATIGDYSINFTFGGGDYNLSEPRRISLDRLNESFLHADADQSEINGDEVDCLDGKRCLIISVKNLFGSPIQPSGSEKALGGTIFKVWINLETGLQYKFESSYLYSDGSEEVRSTRQVLLVEKMENAPEEIVGILDRVVLP